MSTEKSRHFPSCLALIDLEQLAEQLRHGDLAQKAVRLLSRDEKDIFTSFSYPKRRVEWLGGRIAGKAAALLLHRDNLSAEQMAAMAIVPRADGSPELRTAKASDRLPAVSISHSGRFAVGMAAYSPSCGVDIQKITDRTQKVSPRFATPEEITLLEKKIPTLDPVERLSLLWSAKEALKKGLLGNQPVLFQGVLLKQLDTDGCISLYLGYPGRQSRPALVEAVILTEYILAFMRES